MDRVAEFDCIVVGAGLTGATLAALLGQRGHRALVIERDAAVYPSPRAVHMDHEIVRVLQEIRVLDRLLPLMSPVTEYRFENASGEVLLHNVLRSGGSISGWEPSYMFVQPELEQALRDRLAEIAGVTTWYDATCVDLAQGAGNVELSVRRDRKAEIERVRCRYVIGCDGASSFVRGRLGVAMEDLGFDEPWAVVDTKLKRDVGLPDTTAYQFCNPARPTTCVPAGPGRRRWEFMLLPGESRERMAAPETVWQLLAPWGGADALELVRVAVYRFHALLAKEWRVDRVLLAGDAAHQMPPFMGQGMCSGIRDAANLAWKLDLVLNERAGEALLDTYRSERAPHVRRVVETSVAMGRIVCERDPERAAARDARMIAALRAGTAALGRGQGGQVAQLAGGIERRGSPGAGKLFPQPTLVTKGRSGRLDDLVGATARLVVADDEPPAVASGTITVALSAAGGRRFEEASGRRFEETGGPSASAWLAEHNAYAALVRPDHYVYGTVARRDDARALVEAFWDTISQGVFNGDSR